MLAPEDRGLPEQAFLFALDHGGEEEIGFTREAGVSYNPRAARIPQILMLEENCREPRLLSAAVLAGCRGAWGTAARHAGLPPDVISVAERAMAPAGATDDVSVRILRAAALLDFARHLHLVRGGAAEREVAEFWRELPRALELAQVESPRLAELLHSWRSRYESRNIGNE